eukprot:TRINITY_DN10616_c0_g1_i1.p1 TRINITY_DN10616_c0_g1~~TRINITY_DN10616_c0_g1_i1.p1  ORF type:complete len:219 (-),score=64.93 TRINITY_DN10616_c0_g1_i1:181-771(-)
MVTMQPGICKLEFAMGSHGLVWKTGTTEIERVSCQARLLGVKPGWSISMVDGKPIVESHEAWNELMRCKKRGSKYFVYFTKDEASILADQAKADAERAKKQKAAEEQKRREELERKIREDAEKKRADELAAKKQAYIDKQNAQEGAAPAAAAEPAAAAAEGGEGDEAAAEAGEAEGGEAAGEAAGGEDAAEPPADA